MSQEYDEPKPPRPIRNREELPGLAQQARTNRLTLARVIYVIIGVLTIASGLYFGLTAEEQVRKELAGIGGRGGVDPAELGKLKELEAKAVRVAELVAIVTVTLGVIYLIFAVAVYKFPVPITIIALILYLGAFAINVAVDPESIGQQWCALVVKAIVVFALVVSIQRAIVFEHERKAELQERERRANYGDETDDDDRYDYEDKYRP